MNLCNAIITMMKFTRYIVVLVSLVVTMCGCVDESEQLTVKTSVDGNTITITGRITAFDDRLVDSRAGKTLEESYTSSMAMAVFPIEEDTLGKCISYIHRQGTNINFTIDRSKIRKDLGDKYDNDSIAIYLFANMPDLPATMSELNDSSKSFSFFMKEAYKNRGIRRPQKGFPMVGSLGDYVTEGADGKKFILIPTEGVGENLKIKLPTLDGTPSDYIPIPLKALYAKFSFDISIQPEQHIPDGTTPTFTLESYELNNVPTKVYAGADNNKDSTSVSSDSIITHVGTSVTEGGSLKFDFYLPERFVTPSIDASEYEYPLGENGAPIIGSNVPEKNRRYLQRFKPKLVADDKKATYITLNGYYLDHQNHNWKVSYDIYLGEDNYSDFNFKRNTNYVNNVVIRGLKASKDQNVTGEGVFVDHRVNVERSLPLIINIQRETLLDAHYEVRPLRLRLVGEDISSGKSATVKILKKDGSSDSIPKWIRLEKSGTTVHHIDSGVSVGKRKYFTTDLVTNTLKEGTSVTIENLDSANQTVWIYADENTSTASREAIVRVIYNDSDNSDSLDYKIVQHGLHMVKGADSGNTYYIERFEEYLYNFDSEDSYGQINEEGMPWGLDGVQLSNEHQSFTIDEDNNEWKDYMANNPQIATYDFYTWEQDSLVMKKAGIIDRKADDRWHGYAGQHFTEDIFNKSKNKSEKVNVLTMGERASGAVEYCYNRNKRNPDGSIAKVEWYLPSAGELEEIIVAGYSSFKEFQDNYYWTSQPAYTRNAFYYQYQERSGLFGTKTTDTYGFVVYEDNTRYARATKVNSLGNDRFEAAKSGLNDEPNEKGTFNSDVDKSGTPTDTLGYFKTWYQWKRERNGSIVTTPQTTDQWYWDMKDETATNRLYYAFVNENYFNPEYNYGMLQEGYHERTKSNRVRCVRKSDGVTVVADN